MYIDIYIYTHANTSYRAETFWLPGELTWGLQYIYISSRSLRLCKLYTTRQWNTILCGVQLLGFFTKAWDVRVIHASGDALSMSLTWVIAPVTANHHVDLCQLEVPIRGQVQPWPITKWEAQLVPRLKREGSMTAKRLSAGCTSRKIWQIPYLFDMQMYLQLHLDANQGYSNVFVFFHQVCQNKILGTFGHTCEFNFHSDGPPLVLWWKGRCRHSHSDFVLFSMDPFPWGPLSKSTWGGPALSKQESHLQTICSQHCYIDASGHAWIRISQPQNYTCPWGLWKTTPKWFSDPSLVAKIWICADMF